jgi:hypothetical protein
MVVSSGLGSAGAPFRDGQSCFIAVSFGIWSINKAFRTEDTHIARNESTFPRKFSSTVRGSFCNICEYRIKLTHEGNKDGASEALSSRRWPSAVV